MSKDTTDDKTLRRELHRLIIENRDEDGNVPPADQSAMASEILALCEAAALAALPEKLQPIDVGALTGPEGTTVKESMEIHQVTYIQGFSAAIATAQANIHSVFWGGTTEDINK